MNYCRRCGAKTKKIRPFTLSCTNGHSLFINSAPTVGIFLITKDQQVLLARRGIEPHKGMLDSFGGFVDGQESFEESAKRELKEELGLNENDYDELRYLTSATGNYPFEGDVLSVLSCFFYTNIKTDKKLSPDDDVSEIITVPINQIDLSLLHDKDVKAGVVKLQEFFNHT